MSPDDSLRRPYTAIFLLVVVFCLLYLLSLAARPLFIPDEVRYGEIAREMLTGGNWIVPKLNGLLYFEKPPFGYWLNALSLALFGETPFAVRFASAFCSGVSAVTVYLLGYRLLRSPFVAALATFVFLTTLEVQAVGTYSVLDSTFSATLNGGIACFACGALERRARLFWYLGASGLFLGAAFLTKGFLAFALPVLILVPWLIMQRKFALLFRRSWTVVIVALAAAAPWSIAINEQQPDFWRYFFWVEHIQRFAGENAQHAQPFYFYLVLLPLLAFPWIALLPASALRLWERRNDAAVRGLTSLLVSWAIVPFILFSISNGKLATYILPCFVPLSLLIALGLQSPGRSTRFVRSAAVVVGLLLGLALLAMLLLQTEDVADNFAPGEQFKFALGCGGLLLGMLALTASWTLDHRGLRTIGTGLSVIPILVVLPWALPDSVLARKAPVAFIRQVYESVPPDTAVVANGSVVGAVCWSLRRDDVYLIDDAGELRYGVDASGGRDRFLTPDTFTRILDTGKNVLLFCKSKCAIETLNRMPINTRTWSDGNFYAYFVGASARPVWSVE